ncbi:PAS domain S-box-containing protein/diguanylate cyclase (GGDEF)-like protein [Glaciihabitans tibetensis]|uniref:PAS domain S-box-containing protein/diguanylate cyclase (GGDEF)-like protein n=1 Tax=Glaciihabitans tibetensis TaxID=1266600 RepID=A0A2T0VBA5_9MICO|nr:diguanylate cyclase [Glaciihabitans tibetensis]PRY67460.1 PAS domain S-box-containing protein/diguanylate cyclase (GGDEF)-like protein [Glaciihabitans tibetensis]
MSTDPSPSPDTGYFEALYQSAPFGYLITDHEDLILRVNGTLLAWGGYEEHQLVGQPFRNLLTPGSQLLYETRHRPVLGLQGTANEMSLQLVTAAGPTLPVLINAASVLDERGNLSEVRIGVLDASSRVSYEQELRAAQRTAESLSARVAILQGASAAFATSDTEALIAQILASILEDALVAAAVCVALVNSAGELEVVAGTNPLDVLIREESNRVGNAVLQLERPVVVGRSDEDRKQYPLVTSALREARLHCVAVFPIMNDATPIGVTAAFFGRERSFTSSETEMVLSVARQASQGLTRMRAQDQLAYAALHDQLTGLANRAFVRESIALAVSSSANTFRPVSVMFIDLDGFKAVNDQLGHREGDAVLREVAKRLSASVRAADFVGRYGGDEFVVICHDTGERESAAIAARIHREIRLPYPEAEGFAVSASIGIAVHEASHEPTTVDGLIGAADAAMYESKRLGRDRTTQVLL